MVSISENPLRKIDSQARYSSFIHVNSCGYEVTLFENDCVTPVSDIDIDELDAVETDVGGDLTNVKLEYRYVYFIYIYILNVPCQFTTAVSF